MNALCDEERAVVTTRLFDRLTVREREVMTLACAGLTIKEIAYDLGITVSTTNVLVARVRAKLGFGTRRALLEALVEELRRG